MGGGGRDGRIATLTDLGFAIVLLLADREMHGYGLIKELREQPGRDGLRTGTVYAALSRLQDEGLVEESPSRPEDDEDARRRYYTVTERGRTAARSEAGRLAELLALARRKDLLPEAP